LTPVLSWMRGASAGRLCRALLPGASSGRLLGRCRALLPGASLAAAERFCQAPPGPLPSASVGCLLGRCRALLPGASLAANAPSLRSLLLSDSPPSCAFVLLCFLPLSRQERDYCLQVCRITAGGGPSLLAPPPLKTLGTDEPSHPGVTTESKGFSQIKNTLPSIQSNQ